ncbi:MAG: response regulator [Deltaproteobacteria bacterium]|nr:response regulator [Deltaproteobacteria bacterium]MDQ3295684.1 response regulator [Myxococcota bacterium]
MLRVLLVDDEVDVIESVGAALEEHCVVLTARDGAEALEMILREPFDAIVLDLMMPVMTGEELIAELATRSIRTPVIVASASRDVEARCEELGVQHCLQKPYRISKLLEQLKAVTASKANR